MKQLIKRLVSRTCFTLLFAGVMVVLTVVLGRTPAGRLYRLGLGALALLLQASAALLWLRGTWLAKKCRFLPMKKLTQGHVWAGSWCVPVGLCHAGGIRWGSLWNLGLLTTLLLILVTGLMTLHYQKLRWVAQYVKRTSERLQKLVGERPGAPAAAANGPVLEKVPDGAASPATKQAVPNLPPPNAETLAVTQGVLAGKDYQLDIHRGLTLLLLIFLAGHVIVHVYF